MRKLYYFIILLLLFSISIIYGKKTDLFKNKEIETLRSEIEQLEEKNKIERKKVYLLGIINNENTIILEKNYNRNDLIYITPDWELSKMPKHLKLSEEDKLNIQKYVKN